VVCGRVCCCSCRVRGPGFELDFVDRNGIVCRASLLSCSGVRFEDVRPVRSFRWSRDADHFPGWWWWSTTGRHVGFESWLERHLMLLDFDPAVVAVASQPFWLHWRGERGAYFPVRNGPFQP